MEKKSTILQAKGIMDIIAGGYDYEERGVEPIYADWSYVTESSDGVESHYWYSDSNRGSNTYRSQTNVYMTTRWNSHIDEFNNIHIETWTYLTRVERVAHPAGSNGDVPGPGRTIAAFPPDAPCDGNFSYSIWKRYNVPYNYNGTLFFGKLKISHTKQILYPGATSAYSAAGTYRNVTTGFEYLACYNNPYADAMVLGFQFRNNLPTDLPQPIWSETRQYPNICENYMDVELVFESPGVNGSEIYVEYRYEGEDWSEERSASNGATHDDVATALIPKLVPTNHTDSPVKVYWRAKFRPQEVQMHEGDWLYGETIVGFIPAPNMTVPDISGEECSTIQRGKLIPPYTEEQCYSETTCADQNAIRDTLKEHEQENNKECKIINGIGE